MNNNNNNNNVNDYHNNNNNNTNFAGFHQNEHQQQQQANSSKNPFHKKPTLFPTPTGHHHQKKERAFLPEHGTTGVATDLQTSVEVYSAYGDKLYTIPVADVLSFPPGVTPNEVDRKIHLCPYYQELDNNNNNGNKNDNGNNENDGTTNDEANNVSCPHGAECPHIHASLKNAVKHDVHINYAWKHLADVKYECFAPGEMFQVAPPNESLVLDVIPSHLIFKTKAFDGHNNNNNGKRVISHCAHYYYNRICNRGTRCCFVHAISFAALPNVNANITTTATTNTLEGERKSYGRTQAIREFPTLAAAQQAIRERRHQEGKKNYNNNNNNNNNALKHQKQQQQQQFITSAASSSCNSISGCVPPHCHASSASSTPVNILHVQGNSNMNNNNSPSVLVGSPAPSKMMKPPQQQQQQQQQQKQQQQQVTFNGSDIAYSSSSTPMNVPRTYQQSQAHPHPPLPSTSPINISPSNGFASPMIGNNNNNKTSTSRFVQAFSNVSVVVGTKGSPIPPPNFHHQTHHARTCSTSSTIIITPSNGASSYNGNGINYQNINNINGGASSTGSLCRYNNNAGAFSNAPSTPPNILSMDEQPTATSSTNSEMGAEDASDRMLRDDLNEQEKQQQQHAVSPDSSSSSKKHNRTGSRRIHNPYSWTKTTTCGSQVVFGSK